MELRQLAEHMELRFAEIWYVREERRMPHAHQIVCAGMAYATLARALKLARLTAAQETSSAGTEYAMQMRTRPFAQGTAQGLLAHAGMAGAM